jgi:hypothetical protein
MTEKGDTPKSWASSMASRIFPGFPLKEGGSRSEDAIILAFSICFSCKDGEISVMKSFKNKEYDNKKDGICQCFKGSKDLCLSSEKIEKSFEFPKSSVSKCKMFEKVAKLRRK